jgi:hypothetical protein
VQCRNLKVSNCGPLRLPAAAAPKRAPAPAAPARGKHRRPSPLVVPPLVGIALVVLVWQIIAAATPPSRRRW